MDIAQEKLESLVARPLVTVDAEATIREVAATLADDYIGVALVGGDYPMGGGRPAQGIVSERDIVRALAEGADPDGERAWEVMTLDLATASAGDDLMGAAKTMLDHEIRHLPVTKDGAIIGVVSERDVMRTLVDRFRTPQVSA